MWNLSPNEKRGITVSTHSEENPLIPALKYFILHQIHVTLKLFPGFLHRSLQLLKIVFCIKNIFILHEIDITVKLFTTFSSQISNEGLSGVHISLIHWGEVWKIVRSRGGNGHCWGDEEIYEMRSAAILSQNFDSGTA